ncbi:MAG: hypothetical protein AAGD23_11900 [Pseudomonadota bacterium]
MTIEDKKSDRWVIARRAYERAMLDPGALAALMGVSLKVVVKRLRREAWSDPRQTDERDDAVASAGSIQTEAQGVLAQFRRELAGQVAAFADSTPERTVPDRDAAGTAAEKNARTLQMMLRNFEKLTELTGQSEHEMAGGGTDGDSQLPAFRAELARRLEALRAEPGS